MARASTGTDHTPVGDEQIAAVRRFNRLYTRELGLLRRNFLDMPWSLGEMRVLYEVAHGVDVTAASIARELDLDTAYLSRLTRRFEADGLIVRKPAPEDARQQRLEMTRAGEELFAAADRRQADLVASMLAPFSPAERARLVGSMNGIATLIDRTSERMEAEAGVATLRAPRAGDLSWIASANAEIYEREYGWGGNFEGLCTQIITDFIQHFDPVKERTWIAELNGERVGAIMLVKDREGTGAEADAEVARIRLLILDPRARGHGLGSRLVETAIRFARDVGYQRIVLWTHSVLTAARAIYAKAGFRITGTEVHDGWGKPEVSEFWELELVEAT